MAYDMSDEMEAKLLVVHVFDYPTFLDDISLKSKAAFPDLEGNAFNTLKIYYRNSKADSITTPKWKESNFSSKIFHCDLVKRMEYYGKIPLLSFNAKHYGIFHLELLQEINLNRQN